MVTPFSVNSYSEQILISSSGNVSIYCQWISIWNLFSYIIGFQRIYNIRSEYLLFLHWRCCSLSSSTTSVISPTSTGFDKLRERQYHLTLSENKPTNTETTSTVKDLMHLDFKFDLVDVGALFLCVLVGVWYLLKRHWIANNIFGIAFSINAIEILHFNK